MINLSSTIEPISCFVDDKDCPINVTPNAKSAVGAAAPANISSKREGVVGSFIPMANVKNPRITESNNGFHNKERITFFKDFVKEFDFDFAAEKAVRVNKTMVSATNINAIGIPDSSPKANMQRGIPMYP